MGALKRLSDYLTKLNTLRTSSILDVKFESPTVKTFTLQDKLCSKAKPGQFLMLWIPGIDEIPLSILNAGEGQVSVSVKKVGDATRHLHAMERGELVGIRGPFGNSFTESRGRVLLVGGGTGTAPLLFLAKRLAAKADKLSFIIGAQTKSELLFLKELDAVCAEESILSTTEDGSFGIQCLATEPLENLLDKQNFNMIYTCGPESMMRKIFDLAEKRRIPMEASLERLMRCGIGLCGSCVIGKYRVCRDGPVFNFSQLSEVKDEFGISKLGFDGNLIPI
jgi:dihydroorotate dehydrogenase electron transfer subunit